MCAADEQNATFPPFEVPDAFYLVPSALRPPSNIQWLQKSLDFGIQKKNSHRKTYLSIPYCRNFNNMATVMRGDTWCWLLLKFRWLIGVGLRVMCFLFLHLYPFLRVMTYVESNVRMGKGRDSRVWPASMKHRLPLCGAHATRRLRQFGHSAYERKGFWPTAESAVGLICPLYGNCCVGTAKCA
jgi:hypothetical protein